MKFKTCAFGALSLTFGAILHAQNIVYDVPIISTSFQIEEGTEYADGAVLGGSDRLVTEASLIVVSDSVRTADVTFSLYEAIPVGAPSPDLEDLRPADTALGSVTLSNVSFTAGAVNPTQLIFSGIDTLVSDTVFWAVEFENVSNLTPQSQFGPLLGNPNALTVGGSATDPARLYSRDEDLFSNAWLETTIPGQNSTLAVTITAVPEPSVALLSLLAVTGLLRRRRTA